MTEKMFPPQQPIPRSDHNPFGPDTLPNPMEIPSRGENPVPVRDGIPYTHRSEGHHEEMAVNWEKQTEHMKPARLVDDKEDGR